MKLNVSRQAISKWESNKAYPDIDNLILLRDIFNVTLDDLIISENNTKSEDINEATESSGDTKLHNIKSNNVKKCSEEDEAGINLMFGGSIIGISIGMIIGNFMWASAGCFIGMGIGYILEKIKK